MTRRCSHCGHNGHNSRTCPDKGVRIFGVRLADNFMRKSVSTGNLNHYANAGNLPTTPEHSDNGANQENGYNSDGGGQSSSNNKERKKGVPWTEEEHRLFLIGLNKLGKGDWRGISRNFVQTRTPTQVASHAQKYFIRQNNLNKRKRRSSLFDIGTDMTSVKGLGRSMSTPSLPTLAEDPETPDSPTPNKQPTSTDPKHPPFLPPQMMQPSHPTHLSLTPNPFVLPPMFDVNCPQSFPSALPPFGFPGHFNPSMGFPMPIPIMHGLPVDFPHPMHTTMPPNESKFSKAADDANNLPTGDAQPVHMPSWPPPLDPAVSHRLGYELMMRMREKAASQVTEEENKDADKLSSQSSFPREETASSWQKTEEEESSSKAPSTDVVMTHHKESADPSEKEASMRDEYFKHMGFPNHFMFGQFPIPYSPFAPPSFLIPGPAPAPPIPSALHPGIHRPRPSMAPVSTLLPSRGEGACEESSIKNSPDDNTPPSVEPSPLTLKLLDGQERQSAFHPKPTYGTSGLSNETRDVSSSPISVV